MNKKKLGNPWRITLATTKIKQNVLIENYSIEFVCGHFPTENFNFTPQTDLKTKNPFILVMS